ncbi:MAG: RHS repeat domain-containing protein [Vicinamibacterales bacterium]
MLATSEAPETLQNCGRLYCRGPRVPPGGQRTAATCDHLDRQTSVTDAVGGVTNLAYDPNGNLLSLTDARTHTTGFTYDILDRLDTRTDPLTHTETSVRDLLGNLTRHTDRKGQVTTYAYDPLNRRTFAGFGTVGSPPSATYESTVATTFDEGNRVVTLVDSQAGTIQRTYDGLDRLVTETTPQGSVTYTYDAAGRRTSFTVAGQPTVTYTYDNANRLLTIQQGATLVTYTYDDADRRTSVTLPNGILVETGYDAASRVTSLTYRLGAAVLGDLTYTYNAAGERVEIGGTFARTGLPAAVASAAYDPANRGTAFGGATLAHDPNGNLTTHGSTTYTWDARDRLVGLSGPGLAGAFSYDADGRRTSKTINGITTGFVYDGWNPVQELSGTSPSANLLTGLAMDEYLARDAGDGPRSFLADALGSTVALATPGGAVETSYTYEPFGATTVAGAATGSRFTFTGRELDAEGLLYFRHRYYSHTLQRFTTEDPKGFEARAATLYEYVGNNPIGFSDRCGLEREPRCRDAMLGIGGRLIACLGLTHMLFGVTTELAMALACAPTGGGGPLAYGACLAAMHHALGPAMHMINGARLATCLAIAYDDYRQSGCRSW